MTNSGGDYRLKCYFTGTQERNFELLCGSLKGHSVNDSLKHGEKAKEFVFVIEGNLEMRTGAGNYSLKERDALMFDASKNHSYVNSCDGEARFMILNYYPD